MKRLFKTMAGLWLVAVVVIGIGGTWLSRGGDEVILAAAVGQSREELQAAKEEKLARREARREAARNRDGGWGQDTDAENRDDAGWAR